MKKRAEIRIRDPFILTDRENGCYYMYGTTALGDGTIAAFNTFSVYRSYDLEVFEEPKVVVDGTRLGLRGKYDFWAPEVHKYNGKYYLFGSVKSDTMHRGTQIFVCDTPDGEFTPVSDGPATPSDWECLDGTLWIEDGEPYMVFSHEWTQVRNGEICAMKLSRDLTHAVGEPFLLFRATDNPIVCEGKDIEVSNFVTDGPFLYKRDDRLVMIWSSFSRGRYLVLEAESDSLLGKWEHHGSKFDFDGGHAMLFYTLEGKRMISLHSPNKSNFERAFFAEY